MITMVEEKIDERKEADEVVRRLIQRCRKLVFDCENLANLRGWSLEDKIGRDERWERIEGLIDSAYQLGLSQGKLEIAYVLALKTDKMCHG